MTAKKKKTPTEILAHKRQLKAAQMARYRADRKTVHLTTRERTLLWHAMTLFINSGSSLAGGKDPAARAAINAECQLIARKISSEGEA